MKYRDNMTLLEKEMLLRELRFIDNCLRQCDELRDLQQAVFNLECDIDAEKELRKAALNHRGQP
jgi:hypothetical protein